MSTQPKDSPTLFEQFFSPLGLLLLCIIIIVGGMYLRMTDPDRKPAGPKVLTAEEQQIKAEATLKLMVEESNERERQRQKKVEEEYQRLKRGGK